MIPPEQPLSQASVAAWRDICVLGTLLGNKHTVVNMREGGLLSRVYLYLLVGETDSNTS